MAEIYPNGVRLSADEQAIIREAQEYDELLKMPGWKRVEAHMKELVDIAQARVDRCLSNSNAVVANLQRMARDYKLVHESVALKIRAAQADRDALLNSIIGQKREDVEYERHADGNPLLGDYGNRSGDDDSGA